MIVTTKLIHTEQITVDFLVYHEWSITSGNEQNLKEELTKTNIQLLMHIIHL
jgi:hypothetical protein